MLDDIKLVEIYNSDTDSYVNYNRTEFLNLKVSDLYLSSLTKPSYIEYHEDYTKYKWFYKNKLHRSYKPAVYRLRNDRLDIPAVYRLKTGQLDIFAEQFIMDGCSFYDDKLFKKFSYLFESNISEYNKKLKFTGYYKFFNEFFIVRNNNNKLGIYDENNNKLIMNCNYKHIMLGEFKSNYYTIVIDSNDNKGIFDINGINIVPCEEARDYSIYDIYHNIINCDLYFNQYFRNFKLNKLFSDL
jgi:hypothetical protein